MRAWTWAAVSLLIQVGKKHSVSYTVPVHAGRSYIYMLTFTSWPYFFTAGRSSISFRQLSQVSPAVMRRSMEMAQLSATAQRLGEV